MSEESTLSKFSNVDPRPLSQGIAAQSNQKAADFGITMPSSAPPPFPELTFKSTVSGNPLSGVQSSGFGSINGTGNSLIADQMRSAITDFLKNNVTVNGERGVSEGGTINFQSGVRSPVQQSFNNSVAVSLSESSASKPTSPGPTKEAEIVAWNASVHAKSVHDRDEDKQKQYRSDGSEIVGGTANFQASDVSNLNTFMSSARKEGESNQDYSARQEVVKSLAGKGYGERVAAMKALEANKNNSGFMRSTTFEPYKILIYDSAGSYVTIDARDATMLLHYKDKGEVTINADPYPNIEIKDPDGKKVTINVPETTAGKSANADWREIDVCVNGKAKKMKILGTEPYDPTPTQ